MARLFSCGFEENDLANNSTMWTVAIDGPTLSTTTVRSGTYALRCLGLGGTHPYLQRNFPAVKTSGSLFPRFYYRFPTLPAANIVLCKTLSGGGADSLVVTLLTDGTLRLSNAVTATAVTTAASLAVNTWYRLEARHLIANSGGEMELKVDGTTVATISAEDTLNSNVLGFILGDNTTDHAHDQFFDDIAINDESGSFQASWPGEGKIVYVEPAADDAVAWTKAGDTPAATNFEGVDELPGAPNDATDYNEDSGTTNEDRFGLSTIPAEVDTADTMVLMEVRARVSAGAASQTMRLLGWDSTGGGGVQFTGPSIALTSGTWAMLTTAQHLILDLNGKTKANTQSYDIGYEGLTGASAKRVTALWANIEYTEGAGGGGGTGHGPLLAGYRNRLVIS